MIDPLSPAETAEQLARMIMAMPEEARRQFFAYVGSDERQPTPNRRQKPSHDPHMGKPVRYRVRRVELPW